MKTAVEWLVYKLAKYELANYDIKLKIIEQAKEMFEEQIENAYNEGDNNGADRIYYHSNRDDKSAQQYYKETFKSE